MHVIHLTDVLPPGLGGVESALSTLFESMPDIRFTVLTSSAAMRHAPPFPEHVDARALGLGDRARWVLSRTLPPRWARNAGVLTYPLYEWQRRAASASLDADLVQMHSYALFRYYANFARRHPSPWSRVLLEWVRSFEDYDHPLLFTDHSLFGGSRTQFDSVQNGLLVDRLPNVVCVELSGKRNTDAYAKERGLGVRSWWIPNPIDTDRFAPAPFPPMNRLVVGYAGRWGRKGLDDVLGLAREAPPWAEFRLAIAIDEARRPHAAEEIRDSRVQVRWNTPNEQMPAFFQGIHVFVDPWSFGAPRTSLEALSCGRVVVRLERGGADGEIPATVSPVVAGSGSREFFQELGQLRDPDTLAAMGSESRKIAVERYSIRKVAAAYRAVYEAVARAAN